MAVDYARINETMGKMAYHFSTHNNIAISVSGGSDSDILIHMVATYFREFLPKVHFVFVNTGLEYDATKRHLDEQEKKYNIKIDRIRGMSVVHAVKKYGVPIQSKKYSTSVQYYCKGSKWTENWINQQGTFAKGNRSAPSDKEIVLAKAIKERGIRISDKCCTYSKKKPLHQYDKENNIDLSVTGERRAEGGRRAFAHTSCFEGGRKDRIDKYMPLFFWNDETKAYYKESEGIRYSDCYEVWGFKRTGCVGCPFNSNAGDELRIVKQFEPKMYKACINVFGESYRLSDEFNMHKCKVFDDQVRWF